MSRSPRDAPSRVGSFFVGLGFLTILTVTFLAGVFAGFITGKSGIIPQGRELMARTRDDLPVELPEGATLERGPVGIRAVAPASAGPAAAPVPVRERKPVIRIGG